MEVQCIRFLVACTRLYTSLCPSVGRLVGWSVGRLVGRSHFTFFYDFISLTSLLLPKWSGDLKYGPCPPARDFGSRVSGLVHQTRAFFHLLLCAFKSVTLEFHPFLFSTEKKRRICVPGWLGMYEWTFLMNEHFNESEWRWVKVSESERKWEGDKKKDWSQDRQFCAVLTFAQ